MADKKIAEHKFTFNKHDNGGEHLILTTEFFWNGDKYNGIYLNQNLTLHSNCNSASFSLLSATLTPEKLRALADELESLMDVAAENIEQMFDNLRCSCGKLADNRDNVQIYDDVFAGPICNECQNRLRQLSEKKVNKAK